MRGRMRCVALAVAVGWLCLSTTAWGVTWYVDDDAEPGGSGQASGQTTWYVDDDAPPGGDGTSWETAFRFLQDALAQLSHGGDTVLVAQGVYRPDRDAENPDGSGDRLVQFWPRERVTLLGGFAGVGAEDPSARDLALYETILSGDLAGDDDGDPEKLADNSTRGIIFMTWRNSLFEGFTVTAANGYYAIVIDDSLVVQDCRIVNNAGTGGLACDASGGVIVGCGIIGNTEGGLSIDEDAPAIVECLFVGSRNERGGAIRFGSDASARIWNSTFIGNEAWEADGGAIFEGLADLTAGFEDSGIFGCVFIGNRAAVRGGAIFETNGTTYAANSVFVGNTAERGGAVAAYRGVVELANCTFSENIAEVEGGAVRDREAEMNILNSILWRNEPDEISDEAGGVTVKFSTVRGGWSGAGRNNIAANPRYVEPPGPGPDGDWGTEDDDLGDLRLDADSPCIDAGKNTSVRENVSVDAAGFARFVEVPGAPDTGEGERPLVDMGAYEHQVLGCARCTADLDCDDRVTADDLCLWYRTPCDLDADGLVDEDDASLIAALVEDAFDDCNANGIPDDCEGLPVIGRLRPPEPLDPATSPAVAIGNDLALLGAHLDDEEDDDAGAVFVFQRDGDGWSLLLELTAPDAHDDAQFGRSVDLDGGVAVVGAFRDDDNGSNAGAVYVYEHEPFRLLAEGKLLADDGTNGDKLGRAVAAARNLVIAGAHGADDDRGAAYVFRRDGGDWAQEAKLVADERASGDRFGFGVDIDGNRAIVGADRQDDAGENAGAAYVFQFVEPASWAFEQRLIPPDGEAGDGAGEAVAIDGRFAVVGVDGDDDAGLNAGAVWIFRHDADLARWIPHTKLIAHDAAAGDGYGRAVALAGTDLIVGARFNDAGGPDAGAIYRYRYDEALDTWPLTKRQTGSPGSRLGEAVDLGSGAAVAAALGDDNRPARLYSQVGAPDRNDNEVPDDCECLGDFDGDGSVRFDDLLVILDAWGPCPGECPGDLDGDGMVGFADLLLLLDAWGPCS